ncbi:MAG TPA: hypothetical protein VEB42_13540 [Chitinophagaceae bacterium]|nr:hypothetical protein [Chitinophagaceae bacterium]
MTKQRSHLPHDLYNESWKEELSRARRYKEATLRRKEEKMVHKKIERLKRDNEVGRLRVEP